MTPDGKTTRYVRVSDYIGTPRDLHDRRMRHWVLDRKTGACLYELTDSQQPKTAFGPYPNCTAVNEWLYRIYPNYADPLAYWSDD